MFASSATPLVSFFSENTEAATSLESVESWVKRMKEYVTKNPKIWLIGNKADSEQKRCVTQTECQRKATELSLSYIETSAKVGSGIDVLLKEMVNYLSTKTGPASVKIKRHLKKRRKSPNKNLRNNHHTYGSKAKSDPEPQSESKTRFYLDFTVAEVQSWVDILTDISNPDALKDFVRRAELDGAGLRKISPVEMIGVIKDKCERDSFFTTLNRMRREHGSKTFFKIFQRNP